MLRVRNSVLTFFSLLRKMSVFSSETTHLSRSGAEWRSLGGVRLQFKHHGKVLVGHLAQGKSGAKV